MGIYTLFFIIYGLFLGASTFISTVKAFDKKRGFGFNAILTFFFILTIMYIAQGIKFLF